MPTYSLYKFESGQLKIFGNTASRAKYKSISEAIYNAQKFLNRYATISRKTDHLLNFQIAVVEYDDTCISRIVSILSNTEIQTIPFSV